MKPEELKKMLTLMTQAELNATSEISTEQQFSLYTLKQDGKIYYYNGNPSEIATNLTDFYFGNSEETEE